MPPKGKEASTLHAVGAVMEGTIKTASALATGSGVPGLEGALKAALGIINIAHNYSSNRQDVQEIEQRTTRVFNDILLPILQHKANDPLIGNLPDLESELNSVKTRLEGLEKSLASPSWLGHLVSFTMASSTAEEITKITKDIDEAVKHWDSAVAAQTRAITGKLLSQQDKDWLYNTEKEPEVVVGASYVGSKMAPCLAGTRGDVFELLDKEYIGESAKSFTWLRGLPGLGKSAIASSIARKDYTHLGMSVGGSFFFRRGHAERSNPYHVIPTLSHQLARADPEFLAHVRAALETDSEARKGSVAHQLQRLMVEPLQACKHHPTVLFVIDALDECGEPNDAAAQEFLSEIVAAQSLSRSIRFLITSRPNIFFESVFSPQAVRDRTHVVDLGNAELATNADILSYVQSELGDKDRPIKGWNATDEQIAKIVQRADGLFIYAATIVRYLRAPGTSPQNELDHLIQPLKGTNSKCPLHDLYTEILTDFHTRAMKGQTSVGLYQGVIGAVLCLRSPQSIPTIAALLGLRKNDVKYKVVDLLQPLLSVDNEGTVHFNHLSFQEFITSPLAKTDLPDFSFSASDLTQVHVNLAIQCFHNMDASHLLPNIAGLAPVQSMFSNKEVPGLNDLLGRRVPGDLRYAAVHGVAHLSKDVPSLRNTDHTATLYNSVVSWCYTQILPWLELLSFVEELHQADGALRQIDLWLKETFQHFILRRDTPTQRQYLVTLEIIYDACHLLQMFYPAIHHSAGHVYWSALSLAPNYDFRGQFHTTHTPLDAYDYTSTVKQLSQAVIVKKGRLQDWPPLLRTLSAHSGAVTSIAFSPDGKHLVSGSKDGTVRCWDASRGASIGKIMNSHTSFVTSVAFSPDSKHIVSGSRDGTVHLWNTQTGTAVGQPLLGHTSCVTSVAFFPTGLRIISSSWDHTVRIWDLGTGVPISRPLCGHTSPVTSIAISHDGTKIASGSADRSLRVWDARLGAELIPTIRGHTSFVTSVAFSPDGRHIVTGSSDGNVRLWFTSTGAAVVEPMRGHTSFVTSVAFSPSGGLIISGSMDHTVRIWHASMGAAIGNPIRGHTASVSSVTFSPNGETVVSGSQDRIVCIWDARAAIQGSIQIEPTVKHEPASQNNYATESSWGVPIIEGENNLDELVIWEPESALNPDDGSVVEREDTFEEQDPCCMSHPNGSALYFKGPCRICKETPSKSEHTHILFPEDRVGFVLDQDGWMVDNAGTPRLWIPPSYRIGVGGPDDRIFLAGRVELDFTHCPQTTSHVV